MTLANLYVEVDPFGEVIKIVFIAMSPLNYSVVAFFIGTNTV